MCKDIVFFKPDVHLGYINLSVGLISERIRINNPEHIHGIEHFGGGCKMRLAKFRGIHKHIFYIHLKEYECRYNYRNQNIYLILLKNVRKNKLN